MEMMNGVGILMLTAGSGMGVILTLMSAALVGVVVSLNPDTFVESSGLLDDADVEITDITFTPWNYGGKGPEILALGVEFTEINPQEDGTRKKHEQYYSAGDPQYFRPSAGGATLEPTSDRTSMNGNCNAAQFFMSAIKAGVPKGLFDTGSCKVLKGMKCHVNRVAQPKRAGLKKAGDDDKERTVLLISRVISMPGQGVPSQGPSASAPSPFGNGTSFTPPPQQTVIPPSPTPAPIIAANTSPFGAAAAGSSAPQAVPAQSPVNGQANGIDAVVGEVLIGILSQNGGRIEKGKLAPAAFRATVGHAQQGQIVSRIFEDSFLMACPGVKYDGAVVSF